MGDFLLFISEESMHGTTGMIHNARMKRLTKKQGKHILQFTCQFICSRALHYATSLAAARTSDTLCLLKPTLPAKSTQTRSCPHATA